MARKNPFKGAIILTIVATLSVGLYFLLDPYFKKSESNKENASLLFTGVERNDILEVSIKNQSTQLHFKKLADKADQWLLLEGEKTFDADTAALNGILSTILAAIKESTLTQIKPEDVGLMPPKFTLELETSAKFPKKALLLGEDTPVDYLVYAKWSDSNEIFLTSRSLRFGLDKKAFEVRNKKVLNFAAADLAEVKIESSAKNFKTLHLVRNEKGDWQSSDNPPISLLNTEVDNFINNLSKNSVKDFKSENPDDRKALGFTRPTVKLTLVPKNKEKSSKDIVWALSESQVTENGEKTKKFFLANLAEPSTYEVLENFASNFQIDLMKFREPNVTEIESNSIQSIQIQDEKSTIVLTKSSAPGASPWTAKITSGDKQMEGPASQVQVDLITGNLSQMKVLRYLDGWSPMRAGLDRPSRVVEVNTGSNIPLFFGRSFENKELVVRKEGMSAPAVVSLDLDIVFPKDPLKYLQNPPTNEESKNISPASTAKKGQKVKLEATVSSPKEIRKLPAATVKAGHKYTAILKLNTGKVLEITFDAAKAPYTVSNFIHLARNKFYDGVKFHRVIRDFVVQGGDPTGSGAGGPGYKFDNEDNDLKHVRGALSMAHAGRNTNGSQFFIVLQPQPHLDGLHTVFGMITQGKEGLDEIKQGDSMLSVEVFEEAL